MFGAKLSVSSLGAKLSVFVCFFESTMITTHSFVNVNAINGQNTISKAEKLLVQCP